MANPPPARGSSHRYQPREAVEMALRQYKIAWQDATFVRYLDEPNLHNRPRGCVIRLKSSGMTGFVDESCIRPKPPKWVHRPIKEYLNGEWVEYYDMIYQGWIAARVTAINRFVNGRVELTGRGHRSVIRIPYEKWSEGSMLMRMAVEWKDPRWYYTDPDINLVILRNQDRDKYQFKAEDGGMMPAIPRDELNRLISVQEMELETYGPAKFHPSPEPTPSPPSPLPPYRTPAVINYVTLPANIPTINLDISSGSSERSDSVGESGSSDSVGEKGSSDSSGDNSDGETSDWEFPDTDAYYSQPTNFPTMITYG